MLDRYFECQTKGSELDSGGIGTPKVVFCLDFISVFDKEKESRQKQGATEGEGKQASH